VSDIMQCDVCIIGGGLVGCSTALHLVRAGKSVVLVERDRIGAHASGANFGGVRRHGRNVLELPLSTRALDIWRNMGALVGNDCEFMPTGHLKIARSEAEMAVLEQWSSFGAEHGIPVVLHDRTSLRANFPWLNTSCFGASFCPGDGHANPRLAAPAFALRAGAEGAVVVQGDGAAAIEDVRDEFEVTLHSGRRIRAAALVNAAGAWGRHFAGYYGDEAPVEAVAPQMFVSEPVPYIIDAVLGMVTGGLYLRQIPRGNVIFGGGRGILDANRHRSRPSDRVFAETVGLAGDLIPSLRDIAIIRSWTGVEGNCEDGLPILGPSPHRANLYHAFGFSGHGFQMAPAVGAVLSELIARGSSETDISALSPRRFTGAKSGVLAESEI